jgi:hypothetical protein
VERERIRAAALSAPRRVRRSATLAATALALALAPAASAGPCPNEASPGFRSYLPECRAYEQVTPPYKEGFGVTVGGISEDGSRVLGESFGVLAGSPSGDFRYEFVRGETAWEATATPTGAPSYSEFPRYSVEGVSPDLQSTLVFAGALFAGTEELYLRLPGGSPMPVGPLGPLGGGGRQLDPVDASQDLRRAVFVMHSPQGLEKSSLWPGDTTAGRLLPSLYEYEYAGAEAKEPRLVGVDNVGVPPAVAAGHLISDCGTALGSQDGGGDVYNAVSASGAEVFFTAAAAGSCGAPGPPVTELYTRVGETPTVPAHTLAISEPPLSVPGRECTGICREHENQENGHERSEGLFAGASHDGSRVFFTTAQSLVNGDEKGEGTGNDLYAADISEGAVTRLVQVSRGGPGDVTPGSGANVQGVARVSEDGSHVYFVAEGSLTGVNREGKKPAEPTLEDAHPANLYVSSRECPAGEAACANPVERTSFIATLSGADGADWSSRDRRPVQATPDGRFLVFQSKADLTPDQEGVEAGQVFEYDATAEQLVRVSRGQDGYNEDGNSNQYAATIPTQNYDREQPVGLGRFEGLTVSADGSQVFFLTQDALTPLALNGAMNVYEYHSGQVDLISDGHDTTSTEGRPAVELLGTDKTGRDVFFATADRLVPQDTDNQVDVYDARIGGGFPAFAPPAGCEGESCQTAVGSPPALPTPGSPSGSTGNLTPPAEAGAPPHRSLTRAQRLAAALKACMKQPRRRRASCRARARRRFAAKKSSWRRK